MSCSVSSCAAGFAWPHNHRHEPGRPTLSPPGFIQRTAALAAIHARHRLSAFAKNLALRRALWRVQETRRGGRNLVRRRSSELPTQTTARRVASRGQSLPLLSKNLHARRLPPGKPPLPGRLEGLSLVGKRAPARTSLGYGVHGNSGLATTLHHHGRLDRRAGRFLSAKR